MRTIHLFLITVLICLMHSSLSWSTNYGAAFNEKSQEEQAVFSTETTASSNSSSFWITADDDTKTFCDNTSATFDLSIQSLDSFTGNITLSTVGPSPNVALSFSNTVITNQGSSILTIQNLDVLEPDIYTFDVVATSGSEVSYLSLNLIVKPNYISNEIYTNVYSYFNSMYPFLNIWAYNQSDFGIDTYEMDIAEDDSFTNIVFSQITTNDFVQVTEELNAGHLYHLRLRGMNDCTIGDYNYYSFTVKWIDCTGFFYDNTQYTIDSNSTSTVTSQVDIPPYYINPFPVDDINVHVEIDHSNLSDLTIKLQTPSGNIITLMDGACDGFQNINAIFDGAGDDYICNSTTSVAIQGTIKPQNYFFTIDDDPEGIWTLIVEDNVSGNGGVLKNFGIDVCSEVVVSTESFDKTQFTLYPNPSTETVFIENSSNQTIKSIDFVELSGKLVKSVSSFPGYKTQQIDISDLQSGIYFVKFSLGNTSFVKKLIVR